VEGGEEGEARRVWRAAYERFGDVEEVRTFGVVLFGGEGEGEGYVGDVREGTGELEGVVRKVMGKGGWGKVTRGRMEDFLRAQDAGEGTSRSKGADEGSLRSDGADEGSLRSDGADEGSPTK
jgi:hypothetical protein